MWFTCLLLSIGIIILSALFSFAVNKGKFTGKGKLNLFNSLFAGVFLSVLIVFLPVHWVTSVKDSFGLVRTVLLALFNAMQVFAMGCEFGVVAESMDFCPDYLDRVYQMWVSIQFVVAPVFTFGFVLSLFKNISAYTKYLTSYFRDVFIFSELNEKSLALAFDIKKNHGKAEIVFTDVFEGNEENSYELLESAKEIGAICFKKDILVVKFQRHSPKKTISFFTIGEDETENLNQTLKLIENYRDRKDVHIYVFSKKIESEGLLATIDRGNIKVRRINEAKSLINRVLYDNGEIIFESAVETGGEDKVISAIVVGMGHHGTEMVKALSWFGQMDGYSLKINVFDKDPLAKEKFMAIAPELMSEKYNGTKIKGEAQYKIDIHPDTDVDTVTFASGINEIKDASYVLVALGNDDVNIRTAINLRMYFERMGIRPIIQTIVYNSQQKNALVGLKNFRGQDYGIDFIGDIDSSYTEKVIIDSDLEEDALERHLKWGKEEDFWTYEYCYRSSMASAIHMKARIKCGILGADKSEGELSDVERQSIEELEHRRWNAYMRAEGYIYSGSREKSSRNDLAKMHHDLVTFEELTEEEKRKDSSVGTK